MVVIVVGEEVIVLWLWFWLCEETLVEDVDLGRFMLLFCAFLLWKSSLVVVICLF
jgi:hypothetical protein